MVESDFNRNYNIYEPLDMEWRKFYRLFGTMPLDTSLFFQKFANDDPEKVNEDTSEPPKGWYKEELDRIKGRSNRQRRATSIDEMMKDHNRIGRINNG